MVFCRFDATLKDASELLSRWYVSPLVFVFDVCGFESFATKMKHSVKDSYGVERYMEPIESDPGYSWQIRFPASVLCLIWLDD